MTPELVRVLMHLKRGRSYHLPESPYSAGSLCDLPGDLLRERVLEVWEERDRQRIEGHTCQRCKRERARRERAQEEATP